MDRIASGDVDRWLPAVAAAAAMLWIQGLALAVVFRQGKAYVQGSHRLLAAPFHTTVRFAKRSAKKIAWWLGRRLAVAVRFAVGWIAERLWRW